MQLLQTYLKNSATFTKSAKKFDNWTLLSTWKALQRNLRGFFFVPFLCTHKYRWQTYKYFIQFYFI